MSMLVLNAILAIVVVGAMLRLLSWAIISSRKDLQPAALRARRPAPRPYGHRPHAPHPHWPSAGRPQPRRDHSEPVAG